MNISIVVALPNIEDAKKIRSILQRYGFTVAKVCSTGGSALSAASELETGILICGFRLKDVTLQEMIDSLPEYFELLLLGSSRVISEAPRSVLALQMPLKAGDLVNTVQMIETQLSRRIRKNKKPKERAGKDLDAIRRAKELLMERNHLSEEEAYRYLQKCSMDSQTKMVETAEMVLMLLHDSV